MKESLGSILGTIEKFRWGRLVVIIPSLAFVLCCVTMALAFGKGEFLEASVLFTCMGVNAWAFCAIWGNT